MMIIIDYREPRKLLFASSSRPFDRAQDRLRFAQAGMTESESCSRFPLCILLTQRINAFLRDMILADFAQRPQIRAVLARQ